MGLSLRLAWRNLWRQPRRTWLTTSAMVFSNVLLIFLISLQFGMYGMMIDNTLSLMTGHLQVQAPGYREAQKMRQVVPNVLDLAESLRAELGTDRIAARVLEELLRDAPPEIRGQMEDNLHWIREAESHRLVVGSQARILYADSQGRIAIARAFNRAIREGAIRGPVVLGRDHHDVSGTDSPYRETSNIYDGSAFTADMAVHNVIGDAFRGATWVSLHNGGGVGWGEVINGGFGILLDGSDGADRRLENMLHWDVNNGIARRSWARNQGAIRAITREMERTPLLQVTLPHLVDDDLL